MVESYSGIRALADFIRGVAKYQQLHLVHLSLNRRSDIFCDFMSGQSVLATCILALKYNLHFLKGKV